MIIFGSQLKSKGARIIKSNKKAHNSVKQFFEKHFVIVMSLVVIVSAVLFFVSENNRAFALENDSTYKVKEQISNEAPKEIREKETTEQSETQTTTSEVYEVVTEESETVVETTTHPETQYQPAEKDATGDFSISPYASDFKSYMDYRTITNTSSKQYKMQQEAYTDENGLRKIGEHFCVAMGTYYGNLGDILYIETDEGESWTVILSDIKSNAHTDSTHRYTVSNYCMMEFIVDTPAMSSSVRSSGTVNSLGFQGKICYIEKIG